MPEERTGSRPKIDLLIVTHGRFKTGRALESAVSAIEREIQSAGPGTRVGLMLPSDPKRAVRDAVQSNFPDIQGESANLLVPIINGAYSNLQQQDVLLAFQKKNKATGPKSVFIALKPNSHYREVVRSWMKSHAPDLSDEQQKRLEQRAQTETVATGRLERVPLTPMVRTWPQRVLDAIMAIPKWMGRTRRTKIIRASLEKAEHHEVIEAIREKKPHIVIVTRPEMARAILQHAEIGHVEHLAPLWEIPWHGFWDGIAALNSKTIPASKTEQPTKPQ